MTRTLCTVFLSASLLSCEDTENKLAKSTEPVKSERTEIVPIDEPKEVITPNLEPEVALKSDKILSNALKDVKVTDEMVKKLTSPTFDLRAAIDSLPDGPQKDLLLKNFSMAEQILESLREGKTPEEIIASKSK